MVGDFDASFEDTGLQLTDEQILAIVGIDACDSRVMEWFRKLANRQSLTPEKVRDEVVSIICGCGNPVSIENCDCCIYFKMGKCINPKVDQILVLFYAQFQLGENEELCICEKVSELPENNASLDWGETKYQDAGFSYGMQAMLRDNWVKKIRSVK